MNNYIFSEENYYLHCFVELEKYEKYEYYDLLDMSWFEEGLCILKEDKLIFYCTGVLINKNIIYIIFPKGYSLADDTDILKKHAKILMRTINKYQENLLPHLKTEFWEGVGDNSNILSAAMWLIEDFEANGLIQFREIENNINSSNNINWSRTIKESYPTISNGQPIYLDLITKNHKQISHQIELLHRYAISKSIKNFGWFLGVTDSYIDDVELNIDINQLIYLLDMEINRSYEERRLILLLKLKEFLLGVGKNSIGNNFKIITFNFPWIWEDICRSIFKNDSDDTPKMPKPYWEVSGDIAETSQIPDIMLREDETLYILDAKYYTIKYAPRKLPGWSDLVKQYFYRHSLMDKESEIVNVFIFPGSTNDVISYLGYSSVKDQLDLGVIEGYELNIIEAMSVYIGSKNEIDIRKRLINNIKIRNPN
ncbi:LlaJI family restriction endonuclease [Salinicoccus sp. CNSTN-B1]